MRQRRTCPKGHVFFKGSGCRSCPRCEAARKPSDGFMAGLAAPARRALEGAQLTRLPALAKKTEADVLALHGMGPGSMPKLRAALKEAGLGFAKR